MPSSPKVPVLLAVLAGGVAIGWWAASFRQSAPSAPIVPVAPPPLLPSADTRADEGTAEHATADASSVEVTAGSGSAQTPAFDSALRGVLVLTDNIDRGVRLRELLRTLPLDQLAAAFEKAKKLSRSESWQVLSAVGSRWAELDPKGAAAFGLKSGRIGQYGGYNSFLQGVMEKWTTQSRGDAQAWVAALPPGEERNELTSTLITTLGRSDPQAAIQLIQRQGANWRNQWVAENVFTEWASRDPQGAATAALALAGAGRTGALNGVARSWAQDDPQAAMAWADKIPNAPTRKNAINAVTSQWAEADPLAVIAWARGTKDDLTRRNALTEAFSKLASRDPARTLLEIQALPAGEEHDQAVMNAAESLAHSDAQSALPLLDQLPSGPQRNEALMFVCQGWGETEPQAALEYLFSHASSTQSGYYNNNQIIRGWIGTAPEQAMAWAQALPAGDNRDSALADIVNALVDTDFARAQKMFGTLSPEAQGIAANSLAYNLLQQDTAKAGAWAVALPPGKAQNTALQTVASNWANQNAAAAAQWLDQLPAGTGRDRAIMGFSYQVLRRDPEGALAWALTIGDTSDRTSTITQLSQNWLETDSTGARKWLNATPQLTAEEKERILNR